MTWWFPSFRAFIFRIVPWVFSWLIAHILLMFLSNYSQSKVVPCWLPLRHGPLLLFPVLFYDCSWRWDWRGRRWSTNFTAHSPSPPKALVSSAWARGRLASDGRKHGMPLAGDVSFFVSQNLSCLVFATEAHTKSSILFQFLFIFETYFWWAVWNALPW